MLNPMLNILQNEDNTSARNGLAYALNKLNALGSILAASNIEKSVYENWKKEYSICLGTLLTVETLVDKLVTEPNTEPNTEPKEELECNPDLNH